MLVGISVVRNEADVIELTIRHHLNEGFEYLLIADNESSDGTGATLERMAKADKRLRSCTASGAFKQSEILTGLAQDAVLAGASWVVAFDADEFWHAPGGLSHALRSVDANLIEVSVLNFVQHRDQVALEPKGMLRVQYRPKMTFGTSFDAQELVERDICSYVESAYPSKWICRATRGMRIGAGNHYVEGVEGAVASSSMISCLHVPLRARDVYTNKLAHSERLDKAGFPSHHGWHLRRLARWEKADDLDREWRANSQVDGYLDSVRGKIALTYDPTLFHLLQKCL